MYVYKKNQTNEKYFQNPLLYSHRVFVILFANACPAVWIFTNWHYRFDSFSRAFSVIYFDEVGTKWQ